MKITASHSIKLPHPDPDIEYGSIGASVTIEGTPPESMSRQEIADYTRALLAEAQARTNEHLAQQQVHANEPAPRPVQTPSRRPHRPMQGRNGRSNGNGYGGNGHAGSRNGGNQASPKQVNFIRSLARDAGLSSDDLTYLAEDLVGSGDLRSLSKRDASCMIEALQSRSSRRA